MPGRPVPPGGILSGTPGVVDAWRYKADLWKTKLMEAFIAKSGDLQNTTDVHRVFRAGLIGVRSAGFDCDPLLKVLDEYGRTTPDKEGLSRKQIMQLMEEAPIIIPGVGMTGTHQPEEIGRFEHAKRMVFGNPRGGP